MSNLKKTDPEIAGIISDEEKRQQRNIELIASENFVSEAVMEAAGSCLTNKYAEVYPGKWYYGGCEVVDRAESLARERAERLFGAEHANVQPHSGSQANQAVYYAFVPQKTGTILAMDLSHGGHLSHGSPVNISGKYFNVVHYGVSEEDERIDFNQVESLAQEHNPDLIVAGASAYPREIDFARFREIADENDAYFMVDMAHIAGLIAVGLHPDPVPYADFVTTTTHKTLRGTRGGMILCKEEHARDIDRAIFPGLQGGPLMHIIAAKAVTLKEALADSFQSYQEQILKNARVMAEALQEHDFRLVAGGTDTHLILVDLNSKGVTGKDLEEALDRVGITVNKNTIPFEERSPFVTSGIRIGTPAVTTRGMQEEEMKEIAGYINEVVNNIERDEYLENIKEKVYDLSGRFV